MTAARAGHTATLLPSGRVLIAAGFALSASVGSAEIFDPMLGTFESAGSMISRRHLHRATLLPNGLVLLTGGPTNTASAAEIFDETLGTFAPASAQPMVAARWDHSATLLDDGRVLIAGGNDPISSTSVSVSEIYDPVARQFTAIAGRRMQTLRKSPSSDASSQRNGALSLAVWPGTSGRKRQRYSILSPKAFAPCSRTR
jgi:hypothetical protein